jgi:HSP20 family molecular chaperone IbpA
MRACNFLDTNFLSINGDLSNTVNGGTAVLKNDFLQEEHKYSIKAKLPSLENQFLNVEILNHQLIISARVHSISKTGVVFSMPFGSKSFYIPENVDLENIKAFEKDGYLVVELPISQIPRSYNRRNIDINFNEEF